MITLNSSKYDCCFGISLYQITTFFFLFKHGGEVIIHRDYHREKSAVAIYPNEIKMEKDKIRLKRLLSLSTTSFLMSPWRFYCYPPWKRSRLKYTLLHGYTALQRVLNIWVTFPVSWTFFAHQIIGKPWGFWISTNWKTFS